MAMHGEHMEAQPSMGLRVIQMRGACNHIRFQVRLRVRHGTTCAGMMKSTHGCKGCMEVHGGSKGTFSCRHARMTDISPPPLPPPPPPPIPAGGLEYRREFANSKRQIAWPGSLQDLDHAPRIFSCLLTLHEEEFLLLHPCQHVQHGRLFR